MTARAVLTFSECGHRIACVYNPRGAAGRVELDRWKRNGYRHAGHCPECREQIARDFIRSAPTEEILKALRHMLSHHDVVRDALYNAALNWQRRGRPHTAP